MLGASALFFLGPASVEGVRVWPEVAGGTVRLCGERFPSDDAFELVAQHDAGSTAVLRRLRDMEVGELVSFPALLERLGPDWPSFEALAETWSLARRVGAALAVTGPVRCLGDVERAHASLPDAPRPFDVVSQLDVLVALAKRRLPNEMLRSR